MGVATFQRNYGGFISSVWENFLSSEPTGSGGLPTPVGPQFLYGLHEIAPIHVPGWV